jgi:hypothetical protein
MTATTETPSATPTEDSRAHNRSQIFAALAEAGVHKVSVEFDGSGDSGQIGDILAWNAAGDTIPLPSGRQPQLAAPLPGNPPIEMALQESIETLAYDYLEESHFGWENNDGAFGTFVFNIADRTITLEHNERYTEVSTTSHEF